jgi:hypothetical protein
MTLNRSMNDFKMNLVADVFSNPLFEETAVSARIVNATDLILSKAPGH